MSPIAYHLAVDSLDENVTWAVRCVSDVVHKHWT